MTGGLAAKEKSEGSLEEKILGKEKFADSDSLRELLRRRLDERKKRGDSTDASSAVDEVLSSIHAEKEHAWESAAQYVEKGGLLSKESVPLFKRVHDALGRYQQRVQMENAGI